MKVNIKALTAAVAAMVCAISAQAQGFSGEASVKYATPLHFDVSAAVDYRTTDNFKDTDQWGLEAGIAAKPLKWLKVGVGYNFIQEHFPSAVSNNQKYDVNAYWTTKHRVYAGLTGSLKIWKFTLSLRERYQFTHRPGFEVPRFSVDDGTPAGNKSVDRKDKHVLRSRLELSFKPYKKCRFEPYVSYEIYSQLYSVKDDNKNGTITEGGRISEKQKLTAGCSYKINKHNSVELFYRYVNASDPDDRDASHLIGAGYSLKF
ncbi:MAG: DUF2490 domain-containing protein [Muribaculaceae bacterium]|nr:DUF2490 domain-containing protein [Muribaculaceae bacterium]